MSRRLLNLLTALSLLLCAAVVALWVRSYVTQDGWWYVRSSAGPGWHVRRTTEVGCNRGEFVVSETDHWSLATNDTGNQINARRVAEPDPSAGVRWTTTETKFYRWNPARAGHRIWRRLGFQGYYLRDVRPVPDLGYVQRSVLWRVGMPLWSLAVVTAMPCVLWLLRWRVRRRRDRVGLCPVCGYDLRATPGRCPECGASAAAPA